MNKCVNEKPDQTSFLREILLIRENELTAKYNELTAKYNKCVADVRAIRLSGNGYMLTKKLRHADSRDAVRALVDLKSEFQASGFGENWNDLARVYNIQRKHFSNCIQWTIPECIPRFDD